MPIFQKKSNLSARIATQNGFVSGTDPAQVAKQLERERLYNHNYYLKNKSNILAQRESKKKLPYGKQTVEKLSSQIKFDNPGLYDTEAEDIAIQKVLGSHFLPRMNQYNSQAEIARNVSVQNNTFTKRSKQDTEASKAQAEAASRRRQKNIIDTITQNNALKQRSKQDAEASKAQAAAARQRSRVSKTKYKHIKESDAQSRASRNRAIRKALERGKASTAALASRQASAYDSARRNQTKYQNSLEGRLARVMSRTAKKFNLSKQSYNKIMNTFKMIINKYSG